MSKTLVAIIIFVFTYSADAVANNHIISNIPNATQLSKAKFSVLFWHVYDTSLYTSDNKFSFDKPFALKLDYKRKLYGKKIAERSADEIRHIGFKDEVRLAGWFTQMLKIFPDVEKGVSITGIYKPDGITVFYKNDEKIGEINDTEFGKWFFGIWLSEKTSEPELRKKLLGIK